MGDAESGVVGLLGTVVGSDVELVDELDIKEVDVELIVVLVVEDVVDDTVELVVGVEQWN